MRRPVGDVELAYEARGHGPALLLLHAFPFDRRLWDDVLPLLSQSRRVIAVDLRGFGESTLGSRPASIADLADDVAGLLDGLGIPMAAVLGISMGGYVALAFERRHRARTAALILCDCRLAGETPASRAGRDQAILQAQRDPAAFVRAFADRLLATNAAGPLRERVQALAGAPPETLIQALGAMRDRVTPDLSVIGVPTLCLVGEHDPLIGVDQARSWTRAIAGGRFCAIDGAGHLPPLERAAAFSEQVASFLDPL